jgi:putative endonuclease
MNSDIVQQMIGDANAKTVLRLHHDQQALWNVGVTNDIGRRAYEHREGLVPGFTKKYGLHSLVYFERHATAPAAIHREKRLKKWPRVWKINLIRTDNPDWKDLAVDWHSEMSAQDIENWITRIRG